MLYFWMQKWEVVTIRGVHPMACGWRYTKLTLANAPPWVTSLCCARACMHHTPVLFMRYLCVFASYLSFLVRIGFFFYFLYFCCFCFVFVFCSRWSFTLWMFLWYFPVKQTTYRIGNHAYYWVRLRLNRLIMWRAHKHTQTTCIGGIK